MYKNEKPISTIPFYKPDPKKPIKRKSVVHESELNRDKWWPLVDKVQLAPLDSPSLIALRREMQSLIAEQIKQPCAWEVDYGVNPVLVSALKQPIYKHARYS